MKRPSPQDPLEQRVREALTEAGVHFVEEEDPRAKRLDFYMPGFYVHIEVKQFHTPRVADQLQRAPNVILLQGLPAVALFTLLLTGPKGTEG